MHGVQGCLVKFDGYLLRRLNCLRYKIKLIRYLTINNIRGLKFKSAGLCGALVRRTPWIECPGPMSLPVWGPSVVFLDKTDKERHQTFRQCFSPPWSISGFRQIVTCETRLRWTSIPSREVATLLVHSYYKSWSFFLSSLLM